MENGIRGYRICFLDYMWYVAEKWSEREHANLNGNMLLFMCWLFVVVIPFGIPLVFRHFNWMVAFAMLTLLCFLPIMFCKLRYTAERRKSLGGYYRNMRHEGRKLAKIVIVAVALTVANVTLMYQLGFIYSV